MHNFEDFTYDPVAFRQLPELLEMIHGEERHWVPIIDAAIAINKTRGSAYMNGMSLGHIPEISKRLQSIIHWIGMAWKLCIPRLVKPKNRKVVGL